MTCAIPPLDQAATRVGRGYGTGWNRERTSDDQLHAGMDFVADAGSPILAPIPGRVVFVTHDSGPRITAEQAAAGSSGQVRRMGGYGNAVVLEHDIDVPGLPRPFWTSYNHMQSPPTLVPGQAVNTGDLLGQVGNTTNGQFRGMGAHLHMEVRELPFPGPVGHDGYELDTVDPSLLFSALGIDWIDHHREVGREVGGQLMIRVGGPSDCPATLGDAPICCGRIRYENEGCPHGWMGGPCPWCSRDLGVLPTTTSTSSGAYVSPDRIRSKYASKGVTRTFTSSVQEPRFIPPDYASVVDEARPPTNLVPWVAAAVVAAVVGAVLLKRKRNRSALSAPPFPAGDPDAEDHWIRTTYRRGTSVRFVRGPSWSNCSWHYAMGTGEKVTIEPDWRGVVEKVQDSEQGYPIFVVRITDARDASGYRLDDKIGRRLVVDYICMEALDDNWSSASGSASKRYQVPASQKRRYKGSVRGLSGSD